MKQTRREAGFTLISVLVAVVMLSIGLLALARVETALVTTQRTTAVRSVALDIARSYAEDVRSRVPATLVSEAAVRVDERGQPAASGPYRRSTTVAAEGPSLRRVTIRVDYPQQTAPIEIVTLIYG